MNTEHPKAVEAREQAEKRRAEIERAKHTMQLVEKFNNRAKYAAQINFVENDHSTICYTRYTEDSAHTRDNARVYMMAIALKNPKDKQCKVLGRLVAFERLRLNHAVIVRITPNTTPKMFFESMLDIIS